MSDTNTDFDVRAFVDDYEFRGDAGDYTPTEADRVMLEDAIESFLARHAPVPALKTRIDEIARLKAALRPFAEFATEAETERGALADETPIYGFTMRHFRVARDAMGVPPTPTLPPLHQRNKRGFSQKNGREK